jgi:hypothetical protein
VTEHPLSSLLALGTGGAGGIGDDTGHLGYDLQNLGMRRGTIETARANPLGLPTLDVCGLRGGVSAAASISDLPGLGVFGATPWPNHTEAGMGLRTPWPTLSAPPRVQQKWIAVESRFRRLHENIKLTDLQAQDGATKAEGVARCLRAQYYGQHATHACAQLIGSWAKGTQVRPPRDVDLHFYLPWSVYTRFDTRSGNRQSALLQEIKNVLSASYPNTAMRQDGQVVLVRFESYTIEVVPAFVLNNGRFVICNTANGGSYKEADPRAEVTYLDAVDAACSQNLRPLIRMLKAWQATCNVSIKSFHLELLAAEFLTSSPYRNKTYFWFDWITRDFFAWLYWRANGIVIAPGTGERMSIGSDWQSKAQSAWARAVKACEYEEANIVIQAGEEWQKIFGTDVPLS